MSTLVSMSQIEFDKLEDELVLSSMFQDTLSEIRGRDYAFKKSILGTLTKGQQSLFMLISIYYHNTLGWESFMNAFSIYFDDGYLDDIKEGLSYLGDDLLLNEIVLCEDIFKSNHNP